MKVLNLFLNGVETNKINIDEKGILGDKHYAKEVARSVLIISTCSYDLALKNSIALKHGELSENILIDYKKLYELEAGTKLKIGNTILQITKHCTLCKSLTKIDNKLPKLLKTDRGVFAKVIQNGEINKNNEVEIL